MIKCRKKTLSFDHSNIESLIIEIFNYWIMGSLINYLIIDHLFPIALYINLDSAKTAIIFYFVSITLEGPELFTT